MQRRAGLLLIGLLILGACSKAPTEVLLRETIDAMQADADAGRVDALMQGVSQRFSAQGSSMDRAEFKRYVLGATMRAQNIGITRVKTHVELKQDAAIVEMNIVLTDGGRLLPNDGRLLNARTLWRFEDQRWQMIQADWE